MKYLLVAILAIIISYFVVTTVFAVAFKLAGVIITGIILLIAWWLLKYKYKKARR